MAESADVPVNVPASAVLPRHRGGKASAPRSPRYLTGDARAWRFQMRLPLVQVAKDSCFRPIRVTVRASLGSRPRREAERLAQRLAALCRAVCAMVQMSRGTADPMQVSSPTGHEHDLLAQVVAACQAGIDRALAEPSEALDIARGFQSALSTLQLVGNEIGKGETGIKAVVEHADALSRAACSDVLRLMSDPTKGLAALDAVPTVAPRPDPAPSKTSTAVEPGSGAVPTFGQVSAEYIATRIGSTREDHPDIKYLRMRRKTFIDLCGDRPVTAYFPRDLQHYVNEMKFWPANNTKRAAMKGKTTQEILDANRDLSQEPLARKTLCDGYVANIKTMMRYSM